MSEFYKLSSLIKWLMQFNLEIKIIFCHILPIYQVHLSLIVQPIRLILLYVVFIMSLTQ